MPIPETTSLSAAATAVAIRYNLPVFPTRSRRLGWWGGKCSPDWATTDPGRIRDLWEVEPRGNIATPTGRKSGVLGLAVDIEKGWRDLQRLRERYGPLPETLTVAIPGRG